MFKDNEVDVKNNKPLVLGIISWSIIGVTTLVLFVGSGLLKSGQPYAVIIMGVLTVLTLVCGIGSFVGLILGLVEYFRYKQKNKKGLVALIINFSYVILVIILLISIINRLISVLMGV